uniref:Uncharacterized protein n=1 Tax=viral metagenome TaxID=1070528 RepID=A0A6C0ATG0_9ZZZZ
MARHLERAQHVAWWTCVYSIVVARCLARWLYLVAATAIILPVYAAMAPCLCCACPRPCVHSARTRGLGVRAAPSAWDDGCASAVATPCGVALHTPVACVLTVAGLLAGIGTCIACPTALTSDPFIIVPLNAFAVPIAAWVAVCVVLCTGVERHEYMQYRAAARGVAWSTYRSDELSLFPVRCCTCDTDADADDALHDAVLAAIRRADASCAAHRERRCGRGGRGALLVDPENPVSTWSVELPSDPAASAPCPPRRGTARAQDDAVLSAA